ncbi:hypothetical protein [Corynebacterium propinquum]
MSLPTEFTVLDFETANEMRASARAPSLHTTWPLIIPSGERTQSSVTCPI